MSTKKSPAIDALERELAAAVMKVNDLEDALAAACAQVAAIERCISKARTAEAEAASPSSKRDPVLCYAKGPDGLICTAEFGHKGGHEQLGIQNSRFPCWANTGASS